MISFCWEETGNQMHLIDRAEELVWWIFPDKDEHVMGRHLQNSFFVLKDFSHQNLDRILSLFSLSFTFVYFYSALLPCSQVETWLSLWLRGQLNFSLLFNVSVGIFLWWISICWTWCFLSMKIACNEMFLLETSPGDTFMPCTSVQTCLYCLYQLSTCRLLHVMLCDPSVNTLSLDWWLVLECLCLSAFSLLKIECFYLILGFIGINKFI